MPQAREFLLRASELEPHNAEIWFMLSGDALTSGEKQLSSEYSKKAALADTLNADYALGYLRSIRDSDPDYKQKVFDFVKGFPFAEQGAILLYELAESDTNLNDKINYFEKLRNIYPPEKFSWSAAGMPWLADCYLQTDPRKALEFVSGMGEGKDWKKRKQVAELLIQINNLEQSQDYKEAIAMANQIILPNFNYIDEYVALKKAHLLDKGGNAKMAYDSLLVRFAKLPTEPVYSVLAELGKELGKDIKQITMDVETVHNATAVPAYPFELGLYSSNNKLSLESLKGKVVLLTFWFPACNPCRAEFPHFESVIKKFQGKDVIYIGINVDPQEDPYVMPLMQRAQYSFIPLRGTREYAYNYYKVTGEPQNFLIDKDGKIVYKDFRIDQTNHQTLELMISSLLQKGE